MILIFC